tara:strand:+ start:780 stop:1745 length:966 start_codon:yes stop_codon:yes gene_type:complete
MSWLYSQALVEEYLEDISLDGAPCALSSGTPTQPPSWCSDKTMSACRLSRSGTTFKPLTDALGEAVLMSFLEAFPVLTSPLPEKAQELTESSQACGHTWQELLVKYDPDLSSWRTAHCLWEEDLPECSVTLPRWGMMQNGECWERITLPPLISATGSGLLVGTPTAAMSERSEKFRSKTPSPAEFVKMWPTPTAAEAGKISNQANYGQKGLSNHPEIVGKPTRPKEKKSEKGQKQFPTPTARDYKGGYKTESLIRKDGKSRAKDQLPNAVLNGKGTETCQDGMLNPTWVESYLMGWPIAWTSMEPLSKKVFQEWERTFLTE